MKQRNSWLVGAALFASPLFGGCYTGLQADIDSLASGSGDSPDPRDPDGEVDPEVECAGVGAAVAPLRRMTQPQYDNTVSDLFAGAVTPSGSFPSTELSEGYTNDLDTSIVALRTAEDMLIAAEEVAEQILVDPGLVTTCNEASAATCIEDFVREFGLRAYRRPLDDNEVAVLVSAYEMGAVDGFADGVATLVEVVLQSPQFLYFTESGEEIGDGVIALGDYEVATRISYLLWDTMPDEELFEAAANGTLQDPDEIEAHVRRLLADTQRSGPALERFVREWLHFDGIASFDKDEDMFPGFDDALAASMNEEFSRFVQGVLNSGQPTLNNLLTSTQTEVDATMAAFYGVDAGAEGWSPATLDGTRAGLLTRAAMLAEHSNATATAPLFRGLVVRTQLLCQTIPPPPNDAMANVPEYPDGATERERTEILNNHESCGGCHQLINPIGLGFEAYDPTGAFRTTDVNGAPVDASGTILGGPTGEDLTFDGVGELATLLAESDEVNACMSTQFFQHALGLNHDELESCAVAPIEEAFLESGGDIHELVVAFTRSPAFWLRNTSEE